MALAKGIAFVAHRGQQTTRLALHRPSRTDRRAVRPRDPARRGCRTWLHDVLEDSDVTAQELFEAGVLPA